MTALDDSRKRLKAAKKKHASRLADERDSVPESSHTLFGDRRFANKTLKPER